MHPHFSEPQSIDDVIDALDQIVEWSKKESSRVGYFAALYRKVTVAVKKGIEEGVYENGERMERLDVIFANRYLTAFSAFQNEQPLSDAWHHVFRCTHAWRPVVGQHMVLGINTHIGLDLGIAAAETMRDQDIEALKQDFFKINDVLKSMIDEVEKDLAKIWWFLHIIDFVAGKLDEHLARFGISYARDHAWKVATELSQCSHDQWEGKIGEIDQKVLGIGRVIQNPGVVGSIMLFLIRLTEFYSVRRTIEILS